MTDLTKRLRDPSSGSPRWLDTMDEAANEIDKLQSAIYNMAKNIWRGDWSRLEQETRDVVERVMKERGEGNG